MAHDNLRVLVPKCGTGALLYYQGLSEPDTADFLLRFLKPGMVFVDVGAHIGEYVLLAAARVGATGEVHAFEPHPEIFSVLKENVLVNGPSACVLNRMAVFDRNGEVEFELYGEASLSRLRSRQPQPASGTVVRVPAVRLEDYWVSRRRKVDLVKIDTEGAELFVLRGASRMLSQEPAQAPVLVFEYEETNMRSFGYDGAALLGVLREHGYSVWHYCPEKDRPAFAVASPQSLSGQARTVNLVAAKAFEHLVLDSGGA